MCKSGNVMPILFSGDWRKLSLVCLCVSFQCALKALSSTHLHVVVFLPSDLPFPCIILDPLIVSAGEFSAMLLIFPHR